MTIVFTLCIIDFLCLSQTLFSIFLRIRYDKENKYQKSN